MHIFQNAALVFVHCRCLSWVIGLNLSNYALRCLEIELRWSKRVFMSRDFFFYISLVPHWSVMQMFVSNWQFCCHFVMVSMVAFCLFLIFWDIYYWKKTDIKMTQVATLFGQKQKLNTFHWYVFYNHWYVSECLDMHKYTLQQNYVHVPVYIILFGCILFNFFFLELFYI